MLTVPTLRGRHALLEPLSPDHVDGLLRAATEDRSSYGYTLVPDDRPSMAAYVAAARANLAAAREAPFAVCRAATGEPVGSTRFLDLTVFEWPPPWPPTDGDGALPSDQTPPTVAEIGSTWYSAGAQRTPVNTECKLLLLTYAFEAWGVARVSLKTDARNLRSRTAIARLGATFEGIRRVHVPATDGTYRDSAYYSVVADEWPGVRAWLAERLARSG
jgi:N-acetyltransferase